MAWISLDLSFLRLAQPLQSVGVCHWQIWEVFGHDLFGYFLSFTLSSPGTMMIKMLALLLQSRRSVRLFFHLFSFCNKFFVITTVLFSSLLFLSCVPFSFLAHQLSFCFGVYIFQSKICISFFFTSFISFLRFSTSFQRFLIFCFKCICNYSLWLFYHGYLKIFINYL